MQTYGRRVSMFGLVTSIGNADYIIRDDEEAYFILIECRVKVKEREKRKG